MVNETNATLLIEPIGRLIGNVMGFLKVILGGVFGVYVIVLVMRIYEFKYLREMKKDIAKIKKKLKIKK